MMSIHLSLKRIKQLVSFTILRDRWLLAVTLALPFSLAFIYKELQVPELFQSNSSFVLIPPPRY